MSAEWRAANPERAKASVRRWVDANRDHLTAKQYALTVEEYRALCAQGCAICGATESRNGGSLVIDHDHECCPRKGKSCGKCVRGPLCNNCNLGISHFYDDPELLVRASEYLLASIRPRSMS